MSTSKGTGATAHAIAELLPPELLRFLFLRHRPRKAIEFDPEGDTIPGLFDEFDRIAAAVAGKPVRGELPQDPKAILRQSLVDADADVAARGRPVPAAVPPSGAAGPGAQRGPRRHAWRPRRARPLDDDRAGHPRRARPGRRRVAGVVRARPLQGRGARTSCPRASPASPRRSGSCSGSLAAEAEATRPESGDAWQDLIFGTSAAYGVSSGDAFAAIYLAFLGRLNGPRAGWLLASLDRGFVVQRLRDAAGDYPQRTPADLADAESAGAGPER